MSSSPVDDGRPVDSAPHAPHVTAPHVTAPQALPATAPAPSATAPTPSDAPRASGAAQAFAADDAHSLPVGTRLAEFEITHRIGDGGFSVVYLAWDHSLERHVALKEYMPATIASRASDTQISARSERHRETFDAGLRGFVNEAKLLARFDHPSLVKVYRSWEANGTAYMVMPYYEGRTLQERAAAFTAPPDEAWLLALLAPLTEALLVIHAEHCYHRDIAPDNVILLAGSGAPLLLDFGAARRAIGDMTQAFTVILKQGYAPLEQYAGLPGMRQGPWTDVYALAAVVHWLITGDKPATAVGRMIEDSHVALAERAAGRYSASFLHAIDRALAVLPEQRTQTIAALRRELGLAPLADADAESQSKTLPPAEASALAPSRPHDAPVVPQPGAGEARHTALQVRQAQSAAPKSGRARVAAAAAALVIVGLGAGAMHRVRVRAAAQVAAAAHPTAQTAGQQGAAASRATVAARPVLPVPESPAPNPSGAVATAPGATRLERSAAGRAPWADGARAERRAERIDNSARCSRILQRESLGDTSPALLERLKALNCR